jgi:predicted aconitase
MNDTAASMQRRVTEHYRRMSPQLVVPCRPY